jgi:hypothetical protein
MAGERPLHLNSVILLDQAIAQNASATSEWYDISGWIECKLTVDMDSAGAADFSVVAQFSPKGYYELNQLTAWTTDDYEAVTLLANSTTKTLQTVDSDDIDELRRPSRSVRLVATENNVAAITDFKAWFQGWS